MYTVDQDRMKEYIAMGFEKDEAFRMCQDEAEALNKEEAKAAKAAQKLEATEPTKDDNTPDNNEGDTQFIKKDEVSNIVKDTIKGLKDDAQFKDFLTGNNDEPAPERTVNSVIEDAVQKMRTGK